MRWFIIALLAGGAAWAQEPETPAESLRCEPEVVELDRDRFLRSLSLDLRGRLPDEAELAAVADEADVPPELLDGWLEGPEFAARVVRHHRALLWPNLDNLRLLAVNANLAAQGGVYWRRNLAQRYRGAIVPCENAPARFAADGTILTRDVNGAQVEGWVEVAPHWDPARPLRVCAFDAQAHEVSGNGTPCGTNSGFNDPGCGCGPELRWCSTGNAHVVVTTSMTRAYEKLLTSIFEENQPYTELFTTRRAFINGPIAYFYKHQSQISRFQIEPVPFDRDRLPDLAFTDVDTWVEVTLPEAHAGILTRDAWLLRFQTNRARANRFWDAFLCTPFTPPDAGLEGVDADLTNPDLQQRGGCAYCHALLEPGAAFWGRWAEQGVGYLDPQVFPPTREDCQACALRGQQCSAECSRFYLTTTLAQQEEPYLGMLKAYSFRRPEHARNVEAGPRLLALSEVATHRLPMCVAKRTAEWLLGRPTAEDDADWLAELARQFVAGGYHYRDLVAAIVTSDRYRRVR